MFTERVVDQRVNHGDNVTSLCNGLRPLLHELCYTSSDTLYPVYPALLTTIPLHPLKSLITRNHGW